MNNNLMHEQKKGKKGFSGLQVTGIALVVIVLTVVATLFIARTYLFPKPFEPVVLTPPEQEHLEAKLDRLDGAGQNKNTLPSGPTKTIPKDYTKDGRVQPLPYTEEGMSREILFTEREVNAMIATNTDLADKLAIDLANDLVSARMLVPLDPDFPMLGGKILRVRAGLELAFREGRPVVKLRGVSLMGVPLPNAWLGGMKNIDLVQEFSGQQGGWKAFADGIESVSVAEGKIHVRLRE